MRKSIHLQEFHFDPSLQIFYENLENILPIKCPVPYLDKCILHQSRMEDLIFVFLQIGQTTHDAVQVPFILPSGVSNEGQFAFSVESLSQPTKLKGTLTYMVKVWVFNGISIMALFVYQHL